MRGLVWAVVLVAACANGCAPALDYPVPRQKTMPSGGDGQPVRVLLMSEPRVNAHIVRDVLGDDPNSRWRWTGEQPRFRMALEGASGWEYYVRFTVPGVVLARVETIGINFVVNEHTVGSRRYTAEGSYEFSAPVGAETLPDPGHVVFGLNADRALIAEGDGAKLCVLVEAIGFRRSGGE